ncbi:fimbria/pilus outer membrane usher protein [Pseudomonas sp. WS 5079]|uniref:fimbria/pilus outer membrane usher protein n=1 Tax=Pseudomonas sp. WS 5079 TaxID=2717492 RepID=UPI00155251F9|nr:fimbria/pilus outer membrane usher protein [Pseudomonas sp. WS 5079]NMX63117.1 fimbrial biogenesis outer membrane usher protein [Pseudomonas sp. WS 5079]
MKQHKPLIKALTMSSLFLLDKAYAETFDTSLMAGKSRESDLSRFYANSEIPAGKQDVDIYVNNTWKGRYSLVFGGVKDDIKISYEDSALLGINMGGLPAAQPGADSLQVSQLVQGGSFILDISTLSLKLTVPQSYVNRSEAGYVDPKFWDHGVPAFLFGYNAMHYSIQSKKGGSSSDELYSGLDFGINFAGWQFRENSSLRKSSSENLKYQKNTRYLQKNIASITSNFKLGDFYSEGDLFDSIRVRGVALTSDINMLPNSKQGFSPIVRGVAQTNALVKVIQNGSVVYQESVPPGAFTFDNIQPTGSAGDLTVVVHEADGREQSFSVPFSAVPNMLKEGISQYSLVAGKVNQTNTDYNPDFVQGTLRYGLNNLLTGYAGTTLSNDYRAYLLGSGLNLPIGAVSVDVTQSNTQLKNQSKSGQSVRVSYSKFLDVTATNFTLAAYRYSTEGYYSFSDAIYSQDGYRELERQINDYRDRLDEDDAPILDLNTWDALRSARPRNTFNLSLNQRLKDNWGTIFFSGTQRDYWTNNTKSREYQFGYTNVVGEVNYSISANRVRNSNRDEETRFYLSMTMPFDIAGNRVYLNSGASLVDSRYQQSNISVSGNALESNRLSYTMAASNQNGGDNTASVNTSYRSNVATVGASYGESSDYRQTGLGARGSIVMIPGHILASNEIGSTMMVVEAPKAKGLMVNGDQSIVTNKEGLALVPYATPYRLNSVTLSDTGNSSGAEIVGNIANTVPFAGTVNLVKFETDQRQSYTVQARKTDGGPLPFGAEVLDKTGQSVGFVGQASVLYIKSEEKPEHLEVRLSNGNCIIREQNLVTNTSQKVCR